MLYLFIGFFFLFLEFPIPVGNGTLNLMPACVGGALLLLGIGRLSDGAPRFLRMRLSSLVLIVLSLARTVTSLSGMQTGVWPTLAQALEILLALHLAYEVTEYVKAKEKYVSRPLGGKDLSSAWFLLTIGNLLSFFSVYLESMALLCLVLQLLSIVWYQMALWRAYKKISGVKK